jgi:hypothetical protein
LAQKGEHCEDATMVLVAVVDAELGQDAANVCLDGAVGQPELAGDPHVGAAFGHEREHVAFSRRERLEGVVVSTWADQSCDDFGVECSPTGGDATQGVEEVVDVEDPVLEQIAEPAARGKLDRVVCFQVFGEQHDSELGEVFAELSGRSCAIVGVVGRHPDVDDGQVWLIGSDGGQQCDGVGGLGDYGVPGVFELVSRAGR